MSLSQLLLITLLATVNAKKAGFELNIYRPNYEIETYSNSYDKIGTLLTKLNDANRLIFDVCESIEPASKMIGTETKPSCNYNISYINDTEVIISGVNGQIRNFLNSQKKRFCDEEKLECGELTIIIKLIDLINSVVTIAINNNHTMDLWKNLEIIDFENLFNFYSKSVIDIEIITNITLSKQRANIILEKAKRKLQEERDKSSFDGISSTFSYFLGTPVKRTIVYFGNVIGSVLGEVVSSTYEQIDPSLSTESKFYLLGGVVTLIMFKILICKLL